VVETNQLVTALCRREPAALAQLYDRYGDAVYALALRMTRDAGAAEEISLDAFMQLWQQADRFNAHHGSLQSWLFTMVRNRAIDRMRAAQAAKRTFVEDAAAENRTPQPDDVAELAERRQLVRQAIAQLSAPQRAALELAYYEGLSH